jgi:hypothetical protein
MEMCQTVTRDKAQRVRVCLINRKNQWTIINVGVKVSYVWCFATACVAALHIYDVVLVGEHKFQLYLRFLAASIGWRQEVLKVARWLARNVIPASITQSFEAIGHKLTTNRGRSSMPKAVMPLNELLLMFHLVLW